MNVLIYAGYQAVPFDGNTKEGLGGTEIAIINVSKELVKFGFNVFVSGQILDSGKVDGVNWMSTDILHQNHFNEFDVIISASYVHFMLEFEHYSRAKKVFWAHNTHHFSWWNGLVLENADELISSVDHTVCLTEWHVDSWSNSYNIDHSNISIIGNGIDTSSFIGNPTKTKGKFIWSSAPERGLLDLLNNWRGIKEIIPNANLDIYNPSYSSNQITHDIKVLINSLPDVNYIGSVDQHTLHNAMLRAEFWSYVVSYEETFCITAIEMQYSNVFMITTDTAALSETVHSGIVVKNDEHRWDNVLKQLSTIGKLDMKKHIKSSKTYAKNQTWCEMSYKWKKLIDKITSNE